MSANAARRTRRATIPDPEASPGATATDEELTPLPRRRSGSGSRVVAFPEPTIQTSTYPPAPFTPAPLTSVGATPARIAPPVPPEEPATLLPSDRRSYAIPAAPAPASYRSSSVDQLAIGEIDQTLFDCPSCRRPLALGTRRCPGCRSFLVRSILLRKAATFVAVGALCGGLLGMGGGLLMGGALAATAVPGASGGATASAPARSSAPSDEGTAAPTAAPSATTPPPTAPPAAGGLPLTVRSAFMQLLDVNARFGDAEADLRSALRASTFDATEVATTLRGVSAQTTFASGVAGQVAAWPGAGPLGQEVVGYYASLHDTAAAALDNSVRNTKAYQRAARQVAELLDGRTAIDAAIRAAADAAGDPLPATP